MRISVERAIQILNYDDLAPTRVGKGRVAVTFPPNLHQAIMKICRFDKRKRAEVVRQLCSAVIFAPAGSSIGRNDVMDRIKNKVRPITTEEKKKIDLRKSMVTELQSALKAGGRLKKPPKGAVIKRPK